MKLWSSGGAMQALPQKRHGDRVLWRRAARVGKRRSLPQELWRYAAGVGTLRYGDLKLWRHAAGVASLSQEL